MNQLLKDLADKLGILTKFHDAGTLKKEYNVDERVIKFFADKLGYTTNSEEAIKASICRLEQKRWLNALESIYVRDIDKIEFDVVIKEEDADKDFVLTLYDQQKKVEIKPSYDVVFECDSGDIFCNKFNKMRIEVKTELEVGYYDISLQVGEEKYSSVLAIAPKECYENEILKKDKIWGVALQLYAMRSRRNQGVGDFTDLAEFAKICGKNGADIIGLNPLNVLMHDFPENASPYSSISRLFLNPIYIDVEAVPEFSAEDLKGFEKDLDEVRNAQYIEYEKVYPLKIKILERTFKRIQKSKTSKYYKDFTAFCKENGKKLDDLVLFQVIYHEQKDYVWGGSLAWPEVLQDVNSPETRAYIKTKKAQVEFFKFLQFEADRQLKHAFETAEKSGLKIGFYRDLPVGVGKDSAEMWMNKNFFIGDSGAGAPPDAFFQTGQKWCLGAFNPIALKNEKYQPFIEILRANMRYAGAIRIDHVMSLMRLYVIPDNKDIGTYIIYNFDDMLGIVAIESVLNKCVVVGESIGNVPEGFLDRLHEKNIYSLSVLWAERWPGNDWFKNPEDYPLNAFASVGTHDMTPLTMWWFGYEIELYSALGMIKSEEEKIAAYKLREEDRKKLLAALDYNDTWPDGVLRKSDYLYGEGYPEGMTEAVEAYAARSKSQVFLTQLEDIFEVTELQNLPGTDRDKHPNWRKKLPINLEDYAKDERFVRCIKAIREARKEASKKQ